MRCEKRSGYGWGDTRVGDAPILCITHSLLSPLIRLSLACMAHALYVRLNTREHLFCLCYGLRLCRGNGGGALRVLLADRVVALRPPLNIDVWPFLLHG